MSNSKRCFWLIFILLTAALAGGQVGGSINNPGTSGGSLPSASTQGQTPVSSGSGTTYTAQSPSMADSPNSPASLSSGTYTLKCPNGTNQQDNASIVRITGTVSNALIVPLSTATNCASTQFWVKNVTSSTVTVNATSTDTFTVSGNCGTNCGASQTTFSLSPNAEFTSSQGASGVWEVRIVAPTASQYTKGSCTELWGGSGTSFALTSGDDAIANNACYNDSGVTRTITAVKCRSDNASNTTTVNPTFGSAGTGTTILSGALTCGNSYAYSSSGTVSNASWTTGSGIDPAMGGTLTGTSIAMIVEYTY